MRILTSVLLLLVAGCESDIRDQRLTREALRSVEVRERAMEQLTAEEYYLFSAYVLRKLRESVSTGDPDAPIAAMVSDSFTVGEAIEAQRTWQRDHPGEQEEVERILGKDAKRLRFP